MCCTSLRTQLKYFNPRSHEGNDKNAELWFLRCYYFNPRSHEGNDASCVRCSRVTLLFQSTFPRGERRSNQKMVRGRNYFNPRSHEGNDEVSILGFSALTDFNPRSHEGNDCVPHVLISDSYRISIHVPTRGTTIRCILSVSAYIFQSTFPRGERLQFFPILEKIFF